MARGVPHSGSGSPHRSGGCSAALDIEIYGVPLQLHSDQGRNFVSAVLKGVCELLGIDKTKTTPLHPQSDGMVERFNRTILNNLSLMVSKNQQDWDQKVPLFLLAYRSAVHETTGYSPSQMLFGRELRRTDQPEDGEDEDSVRHKATGHQFKEGDKRNEHGDVIDIGNAGEKQRVIAVVDLGETLFGVLGDGRKKVLIALTDLREIVFCMLKNVGEKQKGITFEDLGEIMFGKLGDYP
ncbi:retrovirus-related Pol polyprotein from transposon 412 [Trichonephila clavipes]|nr:retrovirus-related Pol polyprotein from transposon 412 [Trichonephila clavipes]